MSAVQVEDLRRDQVSEAAGLLARSFDDDPIYLHWFPGAARRPRGLRAIFRATLLDALASGEARAALVAGRLAGVALWLPAGAYPLSRGREARLLVRAAPAVALFPGTAANVLRDLGAIERLHPRGSHRYLWAIGVSADRQRRGIGTQLVGPVLDRCDGTAMPCYLETSRDRNRAWYERLGFEVLGEYEARGSGPPVWGMWREARSRRGKTEKSR